jgi:hypothetical protein
VGLIGSDQYMDLKRSVGYVFILFLYILIVFINLILLLYCTKY